VHERRQRPYVIGQLLTAIPQRLNLRLGGRIGDREPTDCAVDDAERHRRLVGSGRLNNRCHQLTLEQFRGVKAWPSRPGLKGGGSSQTGGASAARVPAGRIQLKAAQHQLAPISRPGGPTAVPTGEP